MIGGAEEISRVFCIRRKDTIAIADDFLNWDCRRIVCECHGKALWGLLIPMIFSVLLALTFSAYEIVIQTINAFEFI